MRILIVCSKSFYGEIPRIKEELEKYGDTVVLPNCIDDPSTESRMKEISKNRHAQFKADMYEQSENLIATVDAVLVLNMKRDGKPYIGGATFLELYEAFKRRRPIYSYFEFDQSSLSDELVGFGITSIDGEVGRIDRRCDFQNMKYKYELLEGDFNAVVNSVNNMIVDVLGSEYTGVINRFPGCCPNKIVGDMCDKFKELNKSITIYRAVLVGVSVALMGVSLVLIL